MATESASYIAGLDATRPDASEPVAEGKDHLRLLKAVLQATFPNLNGPVTATDEDLSATIGLPTRIGAVEAAYAKKSLANTFTADQAVAGTLNATTIKQNGFTLVPTGTVVSWYGNIAAIPGGWLLCDGTLGTPDLRDRFVIGAGGTLAVGATVGTNLQTGTTAAAGSHSHGGTTDAAGAHTHSGITDTNGAHLHGGLTVPTSLTVDQIPPHTHTTTSAVLVGLNNGAPGPGGFDTAWNPTLVGTTFTGGGATHVHGINVDGAHAHNLIVNGAAAHAHTIQSDGSHTHTATFDNRPASLALVFIIKT